jgi:hypothetical protein
VLDLWKLPHLSWGYERRTTTATVAGVSVLCGLAARAMLPVDGPAPRVVPVLAAGAGAYVVLRAGHASGLSKRLKHEWLDRFGGDVDDAQTWLLGTLGGLATLVALREVRRIPERLRR